MNYILGLLLLAFATTMIYANPPAEALLMETLTKAQTVGNQLMTRHGSSSISRTATAF